MTFMALYAPCKLKKTIKELLILEFDEKRSKNKELLEQGLELGSLYEKVRISCKTSVM